MDITNIQTFLTVKNVQNFTIAAKELGYAQSTVSAQIKQLEDELGYPLFERSGKNIFITSLGGQFVPIAEDMLRLYNKARNLGENILEVSATLRIGILESLLSSFTEKVVPRFCERYKNVDLQISVNNTAELTSLLNQGQIDLAYISNTAKENFGLRCFYTKTEELVFVASTQHALCGMSQADLKTILSFPLITTERTGICYINLQEIMYEQGMSAKHLMEINNTNAICSLLMRNEAVAFLPAYSVMQKVKDGTLSILNTNFSTQEYYIKILSRKNKWIEPYMEDMISMISDSAAAEE